MTSVRIATPPGSDEPALAAALERLLAVFQAAAIPFELQSGWDWQGSWDGGPLLLLYAPPDLALVRSLLEAPDGLAGQYRRLRVTLADCPPPLPEANLRLVNLALSSAPGLIGWTATRLLQADGDGGETQTQRPVPEADLWYCPRPEPLSASISLELLGSEPEILEAYLALEAHPLAAAAEGREPDLHYRDRLLDAVRVERMLDQQQAIAHARAELQQLGRELGAARAELIDAAWIRQQLSEQLQAMEAALGELEVCRNALKQVDAGLLRQAELEANLQMIQATLEQSVHVSRNQSLLQEAASTQVRQLQIQISRMAGA